MQIVDLDDRNLSLYLVCLEDWSDELKEAGNRKQEWYRRMKDKGLRVKLALDDNGTAGGMIQYVPIEQTFAEGTGLYFINCIWVHGYKQGRGDFRRRGMGFAHPGIHACFLVQKAWLSGRRPAGHPGSSLETVHN